MIAFIRVERPPWTSIFTLTTILDSEANTISAVEAGATSVNVTVNGLENGRAMPDWKKLRLHSVWTFSFFLRRAVLFHRRIWRSSFYLAILTLTRVPLDQIAVIALACNIMVVSTSSYPYVRNGHLQWYMVWPFLIASVPFAWVGGHIHLPATAYKLLLGFVLLISGIAIFIQARPLEHRPLRKLPRSVRTHLVAGGFGVRSYKRPAPLPFPVCFHRIFNHTNGSRGVSIS